jgi:hypothetical protein
VEPVYHVTEEQLEQYSLGKLPVSEIPRLEEHLLICVACQDQLDALSEFGAGMKNVLQSDPGQLRQDSPANWFRWLRRPAFSMALGLAALVLVIGIFSRNKVQFAPAAALQLTALRGNMPSAVPAREFDLTLADGPHEGGPFRVEVVGAAGQMMWNGLAESTPSGVQVKVLQRLEPGDYFVRLYADSGKVMHEYGFRVRP